jgi:phosphoserine aminotransferase
MSVMEVSHRSGAFKDCAAHAEQGIRDLLGISDNYSVLFLQGGATGQFSAVPMNLALPGEKAQYINTGSWSSKAVKAAQIQGVATEVIADQAASNYTTTPAPSDIVIDPTAKYVHYTPNETISGVEFGYIPETGAVPLVADMSSTILSRPFDVSKLGVIYAGAQKNLGPSGLTLVIVRKDLEGHARSTTPNVWDWAQMDSKDSMLNTPPCFGIYLLGLVTDWVKNMGGLPAMAQRNQAKAQSLYAAIDNSQLYTNPVAENARSWMNVDFTLPSDELTAEFVAGAAKAGMENLKGHRSVGGIRASIYNAMPQEGVDTLIKYMGEFEQSHR